MVNNQPFSVEEARSKWRALRSEGYFRESDYPGGDDGLNEFDESFESDQDLYYYDPVADGYDGFDAEYWSAVGENADPYNHWGYESQNDESNWQDMDACLPSKESDDGCIF
jgi:hypothetical protein